MYWKLIFPTFLSWHSDSVTVVSSSRKLRSLPWPKDSPSSRTKLSQRGGVERESSLIRQQSVNSKPSVHVWHVLWQRADGRFGQNDLLVDQLLLQVSPRQTPQIVHLVDRPLRQVIIIIVCRHTDKHIGSTSSWAGAQQVVVRRDWLVKWAH